MTEDEVEQWAQRLCKAYGGDPDQKVFLQTMPQMDTLMGRVTFAPREEQMFPLWHAFAPAIRALNELKKDPDWHPYA